MIDVFVATSASFVTCFIAHVYSDLSMSQLTTIDANQSESKEVRYPDRCITLDCKTSRVMKIWLTLLQTLELTAEKLDMLIERLTHLQQALHSVA